MGLFDSFAVQNRPYDKEKDSKIAKPKVETKFQPAESAGMTVGPTNTAVPKNSNRVAPSLPVPATPTGPVSRSQNGQPGGGLGFDDFGIMDRIKRNFTGTQGVISQEYMMTPGDVSAISSVSGPKSPSMVPPMDPARVAGSPFMEPARNAGTPFSRMAGVVPTDATPKINMMGPAPQGGINLTPQDQTQNLGTMTVGGVTRQVNTNPLGDLTTVDPSGKVNRVKEAGFIRNADQPRKPGTSPLPGSVQQSLGLPGGDYTGALNAETASLVAAQAPAGPGGAGGGMSVGAGGGGGDMYFKDLERERTDILNRNAAFKSGNYSPSTYGSLKPMDIAKLTATGEARLGEIDKALTGRSELANEIVKAIIGANTVAAGSKDEITKQGIATQGVKYGADREADAALAASATKTAASADVKKNEIAQKSITDEMGLLQKLMVDQPNNPTLSEKFDKLAKELARLRSGQSALGIEITN